jgi:hypothetical protein
MSLFETVIAIEEIKYVRSANFDCNIRKCQKKIYPLHGLKVNINYAELMHLVNLIIARLKYHFQITPITSEDFKFLNSYLKRTLKKENNFNSTINNAILNI